MNNQLNHYISIEPDFFQELEGEFGVKITGKLAIFLSNKLSPTFRFGEPSSQISTLGTIFLFIFEPFPLQFRQGF